MTDLTSGTRRPTPIPGRGPRRSGASTLLALLVVPGPWLAGGCDAPVDDVVVRDSAGVRVVENRVPTWTSEEAWALGPPSLDLGGPDARGPEAFQWVISAFETREGTLVVAETGGAIRMFDGDGRFLRETGGTGDGPGEFRMLAGAGVTGDTIWAYDYSHRRLTYFDLDGELLSVHPLEGEDASLLPVGWLGDGVLLASSYRAGAAAEAGRLGLRRDTVAYRRFGRSGSRGPALGHGAAREYAVLEEDGRMVMSTPPFARRGRDGTGAGVWVHGDQASRTLRVHDPGGTLERVIRWPGPALDVTDAAVDHEIERRVRRLEGDPARTRRLLSELPRPASRPAHGDIHVAPGGEIWVETAPGENDDGEPFEAPGWHVFGPDGRWLGTVASPGELRITQVLEDRVVGVWLDPLDVEHVQVRPLIRPGGGGNSR